MFKKHKIETRFILLSYSNGGAMPLCFLSVRPPPPPLITCHFSPSAVRAPPAVSAPAPASAAPSHSLSPNATPPPSLTCALHCPHFESCSGCTHEFNLHRPVIVDEATEFFKAVGVSDFTFDSCKLWGWRCRAKLAVRGSSENPLIGLYQEGTHNVVDIPQCKAHHPSINAAVGLLKQGITELSIEPYDEDEGTGDLRYVQVALVWNSRNENSPNSEKLNALANFIWRNGGTRSKVNLVHSVWANFQTSTNNIIFGNRWRHLLGERDFWEHVGGIDISLAPSSFGQANTRFVLYITWSNVTASQAFDTLLRKLQRCIEINKESKLSFEKTVDRLPNLVDSSISWHLADTSKEPLSWITGSDVLVVDPPRKGLDASLVDALRSISSAEYKAKSSSERLDPFYIQNIEVKDLTGGPSGNQLSSSSKEKDEKRPWMLRAREASVQIGSKITSEDSKTLPRTLIYISCGWESFKEDCELLLSSKAWKLEKAHGYNFFPGTQSIEVLAVFKRGQGVSLKKKKLGKKKKRL
ncbi:S-adenosyl-L-methionine-dependent methyltransferases superfamily protein [Prunus dulcis]|uniref:S-adenosyl-L-methionine-dependent methyltransferases superfamily protein n=1 Tax=Prunus dulcis TaxID=3755 RepID=A0A4Y1R8S8_PRUDU|nr:S-adenosyl-L-methionine-dependent methyltransferases superfamily protein [Prunus dulcis]